MSHLMFAALDPFGVLMTIIGLGGLIFFHELGHFLACRLTGTRVEVFSVGFGRELFGWERGGTRYRVSLVPLGGYVKMAAENPGEARTNAPDEFPNKSFSQRLFIMSNGVVFNIILAFLLFVGAFGLGVPFQTTEIGDVVPGGAAWRAGLLPGDVVTHVNGQEILGFLDLQTEVAFSAKGETLRLTVERDGISIDMDVSPVYSEEMGMPAVGVAPAFTTAATQVDAGSTMAGAGGREGDVVLSIDGHVVERARDTLRIVNRLAGQAAPETQKLPLKVRVRRASGAEEVLTVAMPLGERPQLGIRPFEGNIVLATVDGSAAAGLVEVGDAVLRVNETPVLDLGLLRETAEDRPLSRLVVRRNETEVVLEPAAPVTEREFARQVLGRNGNPTADVVPWPGMAAERAGMLPGDRIVKVGEKKVGTWDAIVDAVKSHGVKPVDVTVVRPGGETRTLTITPGRFPKGLGTLGYVYAIGMRDYRSNGVGSALAMGWHRTQTFSKSVILTIRGLLTQRVSARHIGGPIALATATYRMFDHGWGRYLYILAIISINLAILNMLPIPVLDGGQIVLLCAEKIRGKPLPDRIVGYLQMVGLVMILCLLLLAFRNDIMNFF